MGETTGGLKPQNDPAEETRLQIERTRAQMEVTLDTIGERLSPERFKAEAIDAAEHFKDEALDAVGKIRLEASNAAEHFKEDALDTAGRLKTDAIETADHLKMQAVEAARAVTQELIGGVRQAARETYEEARNQVRSTTDAIEQSLKGASMRLINTLKRNPIPTAMFAVGGYLLYQELTETEAQRLERSRRRHELMNRASDAFDQARSTVQDRAHQLADQAGGALDRVKARAGDVADQLSDRAEHLQESVQDRASDLSETVQQRADRLRREASDLTETVQQRAERLRHEAGDRLERYTDMIGERSKTLAADIQQSLERNALAVGIVAAAVGLGLGMMLPDTRFENRTMGPARDHLLADAQVKASEAVKEIEDKAVELTGKAADTVRQTATEKMDNLSEGAQKQVAEAFESARAKLKSEPINGKGNGVKVGSRPTEA